jgi:D-3-phosphoglycerate dehydrogenase
MNPTKPKIAITDWTFSDLSIEEQILAAQGCVVEARQSKTEADLIQLVRDADCVMTQFARLTPAVIGAMQKARAIVRYGIGVDNVDLEAARARGVPVCNVPDYCIDEVADHTLAFMLAATRQVVASTLSARGGAWRLSVPIDAMRALRDLTVGLVGFGRIGREVAARLHAFKCRILVHDPAVPAADIERAGFSAVSLASLLARSDIISLHCPSTAQTRGLIGRDAFAQMKRGVILVNVARGDLVDSTALTEALQQGRVSTAALDVFSPEPIPIDHPVLKMENVILSAHLASVSPPAVKKLRETAARIAGLAARGEPPPNVVNGV